MKKIQLLSALFLGLLTASPALAASPAAKTYQVTGPIVEVNDDTITIEKGREKWQVDRNKETKVTGDLKVGTKVTIQYRMTAESIEVKDAKAAKAAKDAKDTKEAKPAEAKAETKAAEAPKAEAAKPTPAKAAEPAKK